jgi:hypothetical protein
MSSICGTTSPAVGVEGVAHGEGHGVETGLQEDFAGLFDGLARAANYRLPRAIEVGDHYVAADGL